MTDEPDHARALSALNQYPLPSRIKVEAWPYLIALYAAAVALREVKNYTSGISEIIGLEKRIADLDKALANVEKAVNRAN